MTAAKRYFPPNAFRVCVDDLKEDIAGRIYSPLMTEAILFVSIGELLVKMDELFDRYGYPQAFQDKRSFDSGKEQGNLYRGLPKTEQDDEKILKQSGKEGTFDVIVKSRQNTSWQGALYNKEGILLKEFNGEVELLAGMIELTQTQSRA